MNPALLISMAGLAAVLTAQQSQPTPTPKPTPAVQRLLDDAAALKDPAHQVEKIQSAVDAAKASSDIFGETTALNFLAQHYIYGGQLQNGIDYCNEALIVEKRAGDKYGQGITLNNLAYAYDGLGQEQKAIEYFTAALKCREEVADRSGQAVTLTNIGAVFFRLHETQRALDYYNRALPISIETGDKSNVASTLENIAAVYDELGQKEKALEYDNEALPILKETGDKRVEAAVLNHIAAVYEDLGQTRRAIVYLNRALPIFRSIGFALGEGATLNNVAAAYDMLGEETQALATLNAALQVLKGAGEKDGQATVLGFIGHVYDRLGQRNRALDYYNQALPVYRAVGDQDGEATTLGNMGAAYNNLGQESTALGYYSRALSIFRQISDGRGEGFTLNNIGGLYDKLGQEDERLGNEKEMRDYEQKALAFFSDALPIRKKSGDRTGEAVTLANVGFVYNRLGQQDRALNCYCEALSITQEIGDREGEAMIMENCANQLDRSNRPGTAIALEKASVNTYQSLRGSIKGLAEQIQASYKGIIRVKYSFLSTLLAKSGRVPEAIQSLSLIEDEMYQEFLTTRGSSIPSFDLRLNLTFAEQKLLEGLELRAETLKAIGDQIGPLQREPHRSAEQNAELRSLNDKADEAAQGMVSFISSAEGTFGSVDSRKLNHTPEQLELQSLMSKQPGTVAVYAWADDKDIHLLLIGPKAEEAKGVLVESILGKTSLSDAVFAYVRGLRSDRYDMRPLGAKLYRLLVAPISQELKGYKTVLWCTEGILRYVPIDALYDSANHKYAIEEFASALFTPTMLKDLEVSRGEREEWKGVGFGVSQAHGDFRALPNVRKELKQIFKPAVLPGRELLDSSFTELSFEKALANHPNVVHIASHFSFDPVKGLDSFLLLGDGSHFTLADLNAKKDFFKGVDLLTLSACQTGVGAPGADGSEVEGFALLAQKQGARSVLSTLWPVEDQSTANLMADFYRIRHNNKTISKVEALRQAQLDMLEGRRTLGSSSSPRPLSSSKDKVGKGKQRSPNIQTDANLNLPPYPANLPRFAHPYYWAGFTLAGDWQ